MINTVRLKEVLLQYKEVFRTLDLNREFSVIAEQLNQIVVEFFKF